MLHEVLDRAVVVIDVFADGARDLVQVVRRHVRRHADRDAARAVREQERKRAGKDQRLLEGVVVVRAEVDRLFLDVLDHRLGDSREAAFGIAHCRGRVAVDGTEVSLALDDRVAKGEILREADEGVVDRLVSVGMVFTEDVTDDASAFLKRGIRADAHFFH